MPLHHRRSRESGNEDDSGAPGAVPLSRYRKSPRCASPPAINAESEIDLVRMPACCLRLTRPRDVRRAVRLDDPARLLAGTIVLEDSSRHLQASQRIALETEQKGANIL